MERNSFFCNLGLYIKSVLVLILLLGGSGSAWAQKTLSYSYNLEEKDLSTEGWSSYNLHDGGSSYNVSQRYNSSTYAHNGSYSFRFYGVSGKTQYLISPEIETSTTGIVVSFYCYAPATSVAQTRTFSVGYSTTNNTYSNFDNYKDYSITFEKSSTAEWKLITTTIDATDVKYVAIKYTHSSTSYFDDFYFEKQTPYKTPTSFKLDSFDATSATFSWTAGNSETAWRLAYSTNSSFTLGENGATDGLTKDITTSDLEDGKYKLADLTEGTTYYVAICANYGGGHYSEWTDKVSFIPSDELIIDVNNTSTTTNANIPINGNSVKVNLIRSQYIIPSGKLSDINGRQITKLKFYSSTSSTNYQNWDFDGATFEIYLKEVSGTTYSSTIMSDWGTKVYDSSTLSVSDYAMEINLNTPYNYNGGNLQIGIKQTAKASNAKYFPWVVVSGSSNSSRYSIDNGSATYASANPKVTITTVSANTAPVQMDGNGFTTFASPYALDLTIANMPAGLTAYRAAEIDAGNSIVRFTSDINQTVQANTGILLKGTANKTYNIPVAVSGTALEDNDFLVNSTGGTFTGDGDYTYFAMKKNSSPLTFGTFVPSTTAIPSNKAYLKVLTSSLPSGSDARTLRFVFDDNETTGIKNVDAQKTSSKDIYFNLNGQRVAKPTKGMYISNGKKYIVK